EKRSHKKRDLRSQLPGKYPVGEMHCRIETFGFLALGEARQEGGIEGAFGKNGAEIIGEAEGNQKCVGGGTRAQNRRHQNVANETRHAGERGKSANREQASEHQMYG